MSHIFSNKHNRNNSTEKWGHCCDPLDHVVLKPRELRGMWKFGTLIWKNPRMLDTELKGSFWFNLNAECQEKYRHSSPGTVSETG